MEELMKYFAVYLAGTLGIYKGIPVGIAVGLPPFYTALFTALGSISSVLILYFAGDKFRTWILHKYGNKSVAHKKEKFSRWMDKYGVQGLGLMVTGLLGPLFSLLMGMILLKHPQKFILYLIAGIVLWSFAITYLSEPLVLLVKEYL